MKQHPYDLHVGVDSSSNPRRSQTDDVKTGRNLIEETRMSCATQRVGKPTFLNLSSCQTPASMEDSGGSRHGLGWA